MRALSCSAVKACSTTTLSRTASTELTVPAEALEMETGGGQVLVLQTVLRFLQVPEGGALVGNFPAPGLEAGRVLRGGLQRGFPHADRFVPVGTGQAQAVRAESEAGVEGRVP